MTPHENHAFFTFDLIVLSVIGWSKVKTIDGVATPG